MNGYQVMWNNHPQMDLSQGVTLEGVAKGIMVNGFSVGKGEFQVLHEGGFRVRAENLAMAEQFAGQELARELGDKAWAKDVHFTVRGKELSRFASKPWLELSDFWGRQVLDNNINAHKESIVLSILAVTFGGLGLLFSWTPIGGIIFSVVAVIFSTLSWVRKNNHFLTVLATIFTAVGLVISIIMTIVWFTFWI